MSLSIEVIETLDSVQALESEWKSLESRVACKYYQKFVYNYAYYSLLQETQASPYVIAFREKGTLIAVFPWEKRWSRNLIGLKYATISSIIHRHVYLTDILLDKDLLVDDVKLVKSFSAFLSTLPRNTLLRSYGALNTSNLITIVEKTPRLTICKKCSGRSYFLNLDESTIESDLPKKMLKNVKRLVRKVENETNVAAEFEFLTGTAITASAYQHFLDIEASGWKGQAGSNSAINLDPELKAFYAYLLEQAPESMQLSLYKIAGTPVAAHYCFKDENCLSLSKVAYDENVRQYSPGHVLIYHAMQHMVAVSQLEEISFVTAAPWLGKWEPNERTVYQMVYAHSLTGRVWVLIARNVRDFKSWLRPLKTRLLARFAKSKT